MSSPPSLAALLLFLSLGLSSVPAGAQVQGILLELKAPTGVKSAAADGERLQRAFQGTRLKAGATRALGGDVHLVQWARPLDSAEAAEMVQALRADPDVAWAAPNVREPLHQVSAEPNDPHYPLQWWLTASPQSSGARGVPGVAQAWARRAGGPATVAVLDTGLLRNHPDLLDQARFGQGYDFVTNEDAGFGGTAGDGDGWDPDFSDPGDGAPALQRQQICGGPASGSSSTWHGTRIAGQIAATTGNGVGVAGINRDASVLSVRVAGVCGALVSDILIGMRWAAGLPVPGVPAHTLAPARVVNLSFGSSSTDCTPYQSTIDALVGEGVLIVASAGNGDSGPGSTAIVSRPARCAGVFAVGAVNRDGYKASYSSYGPQIDLMTVGGDIAPGAAAGTGANAWLLTTSNDGTSAPGAHSYGYAIGTSFAAPVVSGVASLMLGINPDLTREQLVQGLRSTARAHVVDGAPANLPVCSNSAPVGHCYCTTDTCGAGLLDAAAALDYAAVAQTPVVAPPPVAPPPPAGGGGAAPGTPVTPPPPSVGETGSGGSGGGATSPLWLLALVLAGVAGQARRGASRR